MLKKIGNISPLGLKIVGSLFLVFLLSMSAILLGMWTYQRDKLIGIHTQNALQAGFIVKAGLQSSMLQNDRDSSQNVIKDMIGVANLSRINILNKNGKIVLTSDPTLAGKILDKQNDETCLVCHRNELKKEKATAVIEEGSHPFLRTVITIENRPACHGCHSGSQKITGVLVVDTSLAETYAIIKTSAQRFLLTWLFSFLIIVILISYIVSRFVTRPVQAVMQGIKQVEKGDFDGWVHVNTKGEFSEMADSFNVMRQAINRYLSEIKEKKTEISTLYSIVQRMSETIEWRKVKEIVTDLLIEILHADTIVFVIPNENREGCYKITWKTRDDKRHYHTEFSLTSNEAPHPFLPHENIADWAAGKQVEPAYLEENTKLLLPLSLNTMKLGLICAVKKNDRGFSVADKRFIPLLAQHIATSFANARLYSLATTDVLTTLYTKRYFETKIKELERNHRLTGTGFCLMMLDIDYFKDVNDTYGHQIGDQVLITIADLIKMNIRKVDIACRYGGEEMAVLFPGGDLESTGLVAERIRQSIADQVFEFPGYAAFSKTISIGVACYPSHGSSIEGLIRAADSFLYRAKNEGRNLVRIAPAGEGEKSSTRKEE